MTDLRYSAPTADDADDYKKPNGCGCLVALLVSICLWAVIIAGLIRIFNA